MNGDKDKFLICGFCCLVAAGLVLAVLVASAIG